MKALRAAVLVVCGAVSACSNVVSRGPLLTDDPGVRLDGAWAVYPEDCPFRPERDRPPLPDCVTVFDVQARTASIRSTKLDPFPFAVAPGDPGLLQVDAGEGEAGLRYSYFAYRPVDGGYVVWPVPCPPGSEDDACEATSIESVRRLAAQPPRNPLKAARYKP